MSNELDRTCRVNFTYTTEDSDGNATVSSLGVDNVADFTIDEMTALFQQFLSGCGYVFGDTSLARVSDSFLKGLS